MRRALQVVLTGLCCLVAYAESHREARQTRTPLFCNLPNGITGICTSASTCQAAGSEIVGICGQTRLACCKAVRTCDSTITMTNSHFVHPHFPATVNDQARCSVTVLRPLVSMCQVRVDFVDFMLRQPTNGACNPDSATFSGTPTPVPPICGNMTGQHLYLDFETGNTPIVLNIHGDGRIARSWNIRFTYISCLNKAPRGCLQYYTAASGSVCSLNYKGFVGQTHDEEFVPVRVNKNRILANLTYSSCIQTIRGNICGIRYTVDGSFHVSNREGAGAGPDCSTGNQVIIPGGQRTVNNMVSSGGPFNSVFCGRYMNSDGKNAKSNDEVYSRLQPFQISHVTGPVQDQEASLDGYCLNYQQVDCQDNGAQPVPATEETAPPLTVAGTRDGDVPI